MLCAIATTDCMVVFLTILYQMKKLEYCLSEEKQAKMG